MLQRSKYFNRIFQYNDDFRIYLSPTRENAIVRNTKTNEIVIKYNDDNIWKTD